MPERTGDPDLIDSLDITPPKDDLKAHDKPGLVLTISFKQYINNNNGYFKKVLI